MLLAICKHVMLLIMSKAKSNELTRRSDCPISFGLNIFGDKWTLLIIRDIVFYNRRRFSDFAPSERIATNILTERLNRLENHGIIRKVRDSEHKNQYVYSVTRKGKDLIPTLVEIMLWGLQYDPSTLASKEFISRIETGPRQLALEVAKAIEDGTFLEYRRDCMGITD